MSDSDAFYVGLGHLVIALLVCATLAYVVISLCWVWVCNSRIRELQETLNRLEDKVRKL